jgi:hypothetical protein
MRGIIFICFLVCLVVSILNQYAVQNTFFYSLTFELTGTSIIVMFVVLIENSNRSIRRSIKTKDVF